MNENHMGNTAHSLHPQNGRVGDGGLRGMMEYLNYYRRPPMYVPIDVSIQHENPLCPNLEGPYRMMCAEEALYACGERHCEVCELKRGRIDFVSEESERAGRAQGTVKDQ